MTFTKTKVSQFIAAAALVFGGATVAHAADQGHGSVTFTGSIIDAPCSISPDTIEQVVELGQISNAALQAGNGTGASTPVNFSIDLENCTFETASSVAVTFTGAETASGKLGITGQAKGAGIVITDDVGNPIKLGKATAGQAVSLGNNTLLYSAYLQGEGKAEAIVPGDFAGVADFTLAYN
ncbi:fimbrial protein [Zobellella sp. DQSA1]|uniref:fimbrial protein n=1 Tax=Zobellella sp. DQSA1 TaxID=3342386 RepID=UPI0035C1AE58